MRTQLVHLQAFELINHLLLASYGLLTLFLLFDQKVQLVPQTLDGAILLLVCLSQAFKFRRVLLKLHLHQLFAEGALEKVGVQVQLGDPAILVRLGNLKDFVNIELKGLHEELIDFKFNLSKIVRGGFSYNYQTFLELTFEDLG